MYLRHSNVHFVPEALPNYLVTSLLWDDSSKIKIHYLPPNKDFPLSTLRVNPRNYPSISDKWLILSLTSLASPKKPSSVFSLLTKNSKIILLCIEISSKGKHFLSLVSNNWKLQHLPAVLNKCHWHCTFAPWHHTIAAINEAVMVAKWWFFKLFGDIIGVES